jgi:hypothetical protein
MTPVTEARPARLRAWAADQLGLPPHASPAEARSAFLKRLDRADFVPPTQWSAALAFLGVGPHDDGAPVLGREAADESLSTSLRAEVDSFSRTFWSLPTSERARQWQELIARCEGELALTKHLRHLERGLGIDVGEVPNDELSARLAERLRALFVLRPNERAAQRRAWLEGESAPLGQRKEAARRLRNDAPELAQLQPDLVAQFGDWRPSAGRSPTAIRRELSAPATAPQPAARRPSSNMWIFFIVFALLSSVIRNAGRPDRNAVQPVPSFQPPSLPSDPASLRLKADYNSEFYNRLLESNPRGVTQTRGAGAPPADDFLRMVIEKSRHEKRPNSTMAPPRWGDPAPADSLPGPPNPTRPRTSLNPSPERP